MPVFVKRGGRLCHGTVASPSLATPHSLARFTQLLLSEILFREFALT